MLDKISKKIGFTKTEIKIILFLCIVLSAGLVLKYIFEMNNSSEYKIFNYSEQDSLFYASSDDNENPVKDSLKSGKEVDYKQELFDFNERSFNTVKPKQIPAEKSLNINTASLRELTNLPGIGEKTAQKIIELREQMKGFSRLEDLLKVKGIGSKKFNNIKKYIFIE